MESVSPMENTLDEFLRRNGRELTILYETTLKLNAKVVLELGVGPGYSTIAILSALKNTGGHLFSVDKKFNDGIIQGIRNVQTRNYIDPKQWSFMMADDIDIAKIWNTPIDLLFIDSSHFYDQTLKELEIYSPHVKPNGCILMHDTLCRGEWTDNNITSEHGTFKAIQKFVELNPQWRFEELYPEDKGGCGLGRLSRQ